MYIYSCTQKGSEFPVLLHHKLKGVKRKGVAYWQLELPEILTKIPYIIFWLPWGRETTQTLKTVVSKCIQALKLSWIQLIYFIFSLIISRTMWRHRKQHFLKNTESTLAFILIAVCDTLQLCITTRTVKKRNPILKHIWKDKSRYSLQDNRRNNDTLLL